MSSQTQKGIQNLGQPMNFSPQTLAKAEGVAREMMVSGETVKPLMTPDDTILAYVATSREAIMWLTSFEVDGKTFYFGNKK